MPRPNMSHRAEHSEQIEYWLRRAEQESIAAIRAPNAQASQSHSMMAEAYSAMATNLLSDAPAG